MTTPIIPVNSFYELRIQALETKLRARSDALEAVFNATDAYMKDTKEDDDFISLLIQIRTIAQKGLLQ